MPKITRKKALQKPVLIKPKFDVILATPVGELGLRFRQEKLISLVFLARQMVAPLPSAFTPTLKKISQRLTRFFDKPCSLLDLPYELEGSPFQHAVWEALTQIPLGKTRTYGDIAKKLNTSARAVGMACRTNPIPLIIPCHRVVAAQDLGGYGGSGGRMRHIKQWLLVHESSAKY